MNNARPRFPRLRRRRAAIQIFKSNVSWGGVQALSGNQYLRGVPKADEVRPDDVLDGRPIFMPLCEFTQNRNLFPTLAQLGVMAIGAGQQAAILKEASGVDHFELRPLIENVGWTEFVFAVNDGALIGASKEDPPEVAFSQQRLSLTKGDLKGWKKNVRKFATKRPVLAFVGAAGFLGPLLSWSNFPGSVGIEIIGKTDTGKSLALNFAKTAWGSGDASSEEMIPVNEFVAGPADCASLFADGLLCLDDVDSYFATASARERIEAVGAIAAVLSGRLQDPMSGRRGLRTVLLSTSQESIAALSGDSGAADAAFGGRMITIPLGDGRSSGVFEPPSPNESIWATCNTFRYVFRRQHGTAIRAFLSWLVDEYANDRETLAQFITKSQSDFRALVDADRADGVTARACDAFGLVYAAGRLARKAKVLPKGLGLKAAVKHCFELHAGAAIERVDFGARLLALAAGPNIVDLGSGDPPTIDDDDYDSAIAFKKERRGIRLLLMRPTQFHEQFPDGEDRLKDHDVRKLMIFEKDAKKHLTMQRKLGKKRDRERVFVFRLPNSDGTDDPDGNGGDDTEWNDAAD